MLLLVAAVAVSGCTTATYEAGAPGGLSRVYHDDGSTILAEDQYIYNSFTATNTLRLDVDVDVRSGPSIDVLVLDPLNFNQFKDGNGFVHYSSCGGVAAQAFQRSCTLGAGEYYIVLDNSDRGTASPPWNGVDDGAHVSWGFAAFA